MFDQIARIISEYDWCSLSWERRPQNTAVHKVLESLSFSLTGEFPVLRSSLAFGRRLLILAIQYVLQLIHWQFSAGNTCEIQLSSVSQVQWKEQKWRNTVPTSLCTVCNTIWCFFCGQNTVRNVWLQNKWSSA